MTTEQIAAYRQQLKDKVINFAQYREIMREEARRLGHPVGSNDIIKLLEANANDDNRIVKDSGDGKTWIDRGEPLPDSGTPKESKGGDDPDIEGKGGVKYGGEGEATGGGTGGGTGEGEGEPKPDGRRPEPQPDGGLPPPKELPLPWDDEGDSEGDAKKKAEELRKRMEEADKAAAEAKRKQDEAERVRRELDELNRKLAEEAKRKEEERKRKEEEENKNLKHYKTDELIETLKTLGVAYLVGPAGTGKSTLAMDACSKMFDCKKDDAKFGLHFAQISFSPDTTSGEMVGRCDINGVFHESETVRVYRDGGLILFDEIDNADASMLVKLNTALANGTFATPAGLVRRNPNTYIVCTANTYGTGPDAMYVGRTRLDAATLDRYCMATIEVDYDVKLEGKLMSCLKQEDKTWLTAFVKSVRKAIKDKHFRRLCSTRFVINAVKWFKQGKSQTFVKDKFLLGWTDNERAAVG